MKFSEAAELLGVEDALVVDDGALRMAFREAGKRLHPDAGGSVEGFEQLQVAQKLMLRPGLRLRSWLEERGVVGDVRGAVSSDLLDLFGVVAELTQRAQRLYKDGEECRSVLGKAMLEPRKLSLRAEISELQARLGECVGERMALFPAVRDGRISQDDCWLLVRDLLFLEKWQAQLREEFGKSY